MPPLRERGGDIAALAAEFAERYARRTGRRFQRLTGSQIERLETYSWPGNVRELENVIERAAITANDEVLNIETALAVALPALPGAIPTDDSAIRTDAEMRSFERTNILRALNATDWRIAGPNGAARLLGLPPSTLASRIKTLGITRVAAARRDSAPPA